MKKSILFISILMIYSLIGCKIDLELWVDNNTGAGNGTLLLSNMPMFNEADFKSKLAQRGMEAVSVSEKGVGVYEAKIKWKDFAKAFGVRKVNEDGSILLDFGKVETGSITVHVDGKIIKEKTRGNIKDSNTVVFTSGQALLVYLPAKTSILPTVIGIIVILGCALIAVFFFFRSGKTEKTQATTPAPTTAIDGELSVKSCVNCGAILKDDQAFCTKCGGKI